MTSSRLSDRAGLEPTIASRRGALHFMGVGGVGMAGLAYLLRERGHEVQGCEQEVSSRTEWLQAHRIGVTLGHDASHVTEHLAGLVQTAAVPAGHPEVKAAHRLGVPVWKRGDVLAALTPHYRTLAIGGTHGKTTTSALLAHVLREAGLAPSFLLGGEMPALGGVAGVGEGPWLVAEADESDGTLAGYQSEVAVITNIEEDHMEHFQTRNALLDCFKCFAEQSRGPVVYGWDNDLARALVGSRPGAISFGVGPGADVWADQLLDRDGAAHFRLHLPDLPPCEMVLPLPGPHNVQNALAAAAVAHHLGVNLDALRTAFASFVPPRRRFEVVARGRGVTVISDYAHHPTELRMLMGVVRSLNARRVLVIFQPHRYSRTRALAAEFPAALAGADHLVLAPVYAASESPLEGGRSEDLLRAFGPGQAEGASSLEEAWHLMRDRLREGDILVLAGAGDVEQVGAWAKKDLEGTGL